MLVTTFLGTKLPYVFPYVARCGLRGTFDYRARHFLPGATTIASALAKLVEAGYVEKDASGCRVSDPFHALLHLLRGDWRTARDDIGLYRTLLSDRAAVRETRRLLAPFRKRSDRDLFRRVVRTPTLRYFLRSVRANG